MFMKSSQLGFASWLEGQNVHCNGHYLKNWRNDVKEIEVTFTRDKAGNTLSVLSKYLKNMKGQIVFYCS